MHALDQRIDGGDQLVTGGNAQVCRIIGEAQRAGRAFGERRKIFRDQFKLTEAIGTAGQ